MGVSSGCSGSCSVKGFASESRAHDTPLTCSFQWLQCYHQEAAPMYRARTLLSVLTILSTCPAQNLGIPVLHRAPRLGALLIYLHRWPPHPGAQSVPGSPSSCACMKACVKVFQAVDAMPCCRCRCARHVLAKVAKARGNPMPSMCATAPGARGSHPADTPLLLASAAPKH